MLQIEPIIELKDKVLLCWARQEEEKVQRNIWTEFQSYERDENEPVCFGCASDKEIVREFMEETVEKYGIKEYAMYAVGRIIGTHVWTSCIAISFVKKK